MAEKADKRRLVAEALKDEFSKITDMEKITKLNGWEELENLSSHTILDGFEYFEDEITLKDDKFSGPINIYVILNYGDKGDMETMSSAFPGSIIGHFDKDQPVFDRIVVDTSSFYE